MSDPPETLLGLIEAQAARTPDAVAVIHGPAEMVYADLVAGARGIGAELAQHGVGPGVPVGICVERSLFLTVGLLGTLEAGGVCLPLDPSLPQPRLEQMLAGAAPPVVLATAATESRLPPSNVVLRLDLACGIAIEPGQAAAAARPAASPDDLAFLIHTSGSTGEPKGVMLTNRGLVHHAHAVAAVYGLRPADRALQFASIGFDVSIEEIFPTLATGGAVVLRDDDVPILGTAWLDWLEAAGPTVLNLPTAHWHEWVHDLQALGREVPECVRLVVVGGERALGSAYAVWQQVGGDRVRWINAYGPAEASVTATVFVGPRDRVWPAGVDPPIGRAIGATSIHVLDEREQHVAAGTPGELFIGGPGLARGYLGRPELTAERFVTAADGERLYRTGDLVRALANGDLAYLGRRDEQVKIRGVRVELGDVESALARHPAVAEVAAVAREDTPGDRRLVAYVVAGPASDGAGVPAATDLRRFAATQLPRQMIPGAFVFLERLPLTTSGKVDRDALPSPADVPVTVQPAGADPLTSTEAAVACAWMDALQLSSIGRDDDFFDLGGQSLQATQIVAALRESLGVDIGLSALFDAPTVAAMASRIDASPSVRLQPPALEAAPRVAGAPVPLALSQEHMWRVEASAAPPGLFNVTAMHTFTESVDAAALHAAIDHVARRQQTLRTRFVTEHGTPHQVIEAEVSVDLVVHDLADLSDDGRDAELRRLLAQQDAAAFDLARVPLFGASMYRVAEDRAVLAATFDHLICDGTSGYVFLNEVVAAYRAYARGDEPALPPLAVQYADFALWQRAWATDEVLQQQVEYWKRALEGMRLGPAIPFDHVPEAPTRRIVARDIHVNAALYARISDLARRQGVTVFVVAAAAFQALCSRASEHTDVVVSTTLSGRQRTEVQRLIGCFHSIGRIRTDLSGDPSFAEILERTRTAVVGLLDNHDVPFFRIREAAIPPMPAGGGAAFLASVPTELQYFPAARDEWTPGAGVVERPGPDPGPDELYFRGHMHPLVVTLFDDGSQIWGSFSYKVDWYDAATINALADGFVRILGAVAAKPMIRLSQLPAPAPVTATRTAD